jgi:tRNA threonylcarbamoyladenosine biosynthesis protein TsaE
MELNFTLEKIKEAAKIFIDITGMHRVFAVAGEMGAGKTTFVHAVCEVMGVKDNIASPTFSIINHYSTATGEIIYHIDLYRLKDEEEAIQAGVEDCLYSGNYCFVEWPQKAPDIFPDNTMQLAITVIDMNIRKLKINL